MFLNKFINNNIENNNNENEAGINIENKNYINIEKEFPVISQVFTLESYLKNGIVVNFKLKENVNNTTILTIEINGESKDFTIKNPITDKNEKQQIKEPQIKQIKNNKQIKKNKSK